MKKYCPHCGEYMGDHYGESAVVSCGRCAYDAMAEIRARVQAERARIQKKQEEWRAMWPSWIFDKNEK